MNTQGGFTTVQHQTVYSDSNLQCEKKHLDMVRKLGISEIIFGVLSLGIGVAVLVILHGQGTGGTGVWGGIWLTLAGGFGIAAGSKTTTRCFINTHMTLSIIGSIVAGIQTIWTGLQAYGSYVVYEVLEENGTYPSGIATTLCGLFTAMSIISGLSFIVLIVSASYCCCALPGCCKSGNNQPSHVLVAQGTPQQFAPVQVAPTKYPGSDYPPPGYAPL